MAKSFDARMGELKAEEKKIQQRMAQLRQERAGEIAKAIEKAKLDDVDPARLGKLMQRVKTLGMDEAERRLA